MVAVPMLKMKCIVPLVMLFVGQTNIQLYIVSEDQPHSGNHLLVIVSLRFNRCWIKVSGDIAQDCQTWLSDNRGLSACQLSESQL